MQIYIHEIVQYMYILQKKVITKTFTWVCIFDMIEVSVLVLNWISLSIRKFCEKKIPLIFFNTINYWYSLFTCLRRSPELASSLCGAGDCVLIPPRASQEERTSSFPICVLFNRLMLTLHFTYTILFVSSRAVSMRTWKCL